MGYKLCMAEKPSVAADIARVMGATQKRDGYIEGNGYRVTWAVGHLVGLAEPEEYGFASQAQIFNGEAERGMKELPLIPKNYDFKLIVLKQTEKQYRIVEKLINDPECDEIINCGDMGPEGHILQWFIREKAGCRKRVRRFCATSMTDEAIKDAMAHLRREEEFANIIKGEYCKKKADWILGMSLSRAETLKHHAGISVGRVQSPTLFFIVQRYLEVTNFKVTDYYALEMALAGGKPFKVFWNKDAEGAFPPTVKDSEGRLLDRAAAEGKAAQIKDGREAEVLEVKVQKRQTERPQLYDITELQRDANRKYGYSAALTLATAQALYETQKVLSYPRTDSRYITTDLKPYMAERLKGIQGIEKYRAAAGVVLHNGLNIDKRIVDDSKVTDHHALIPTEKIKGFNISAMKPTDEEAKKGVTAETMRNVLDLVLCRMVVAFSTPYQYQQTVVSILAGGITFTASGNVPISKGWKALQEQLGGKEEPEGEKEEEQIFPPLEKGQRIPVRDCAAVPKKTTPPKLHTEATLLTAMENAGATIANGAILKGRGIGTQATRAGIIETLFKRGYVENEKKGKTIYIKPTNFGLAVIRVLPPELYSPKLTADWETMIAEIADGKMGEKDFMDKFAVFVKDEVEKVKADDTKINFGKSREVMGTCPRCGSPVYVYRDMKKGVDGRRLKYYCSKENDPECHFSIENTEPFILKFRCMKALTEKEMKELLFRGFIRTQLYRKGNKDTPYDGKNKICLVEKADKPGWFTLQVEEWTKPKN